MKKTRKQYVDGLKPLGKVFWYTGTMRLYRDGDAVGYVWRWWNPLWLVYLPTLFVLSVLMDGAVETLKNKHYLGVGVSPFFKENPDKLEWL